MDRSHPLTFALPKGRILEECAPLFKKAGVKPEPDFYSKDSRALLFKTTDNSLNIIRVRAFDVATFVAFGGADMGIVGSDVIDEFSFEEIYAPLDLKIGMCRLSVATHKDTDLNLKFPPPHLRVATKYPEITSRYFAKFGTQIEAIKLNGAMELAPLLNLAPVIVDLVSSGATLKANNLVERQVIAPVTAYLIVNKASFKLKSEKIRVWIDRFRKAI